MVHRNIAVHVDSGNGIVPDISGHARGCAGCEVKDSSASAFDANQKRIGLVASTTRPALVATGSAHKLLGNVARAVY